MSKFFGGGNNTATTTPSFLPGFESLIDPLRLGAFNAYNMPYNLEGGPARVAPLTADQLGAFQMARGLAGRGDPMLGYTQSIMSRMPLAALDEFSTQSAEQRMSPYLDAVLSRQLGRLTEDQDIDRAKLQARQIASGAFGGSRSEVGKQLQQRMQAEQREGLTEKAYQSAFENARQQYNQDRARQMQGEQMWRQGLLSSTGLGYQGAANQRANIGLLNQMGELQQQQAQREADSYYGYPWQQVQNLAGILYGAPRGQTQTTPGPSGWSQALGAAATLGGLYKDLGGGNIFGVGGWFKDGGHVKKKRAPKLKYQDGGFIEDDEYVIGGAFDPMYDDGMMTDEMPSGGMPAGGAFDDELMAILQQAGSPLERERAFNPLLQFGLALLANQSPNALAAIGQAGQAVLSGLEKERLADAKLSDLNRRRMLEAAKVAGARKAAQERNRTQQEIAAERARLQERGLLSREEQARLDRESRIALAEAERNAAMDRARLSRQAQTFTDANGRVMVIEPGSTTAVPVTDAEGQPVTTDVKQTQREKDIQALMDRGISRTDAEDIAAGRVTVSQPDEFGDIYITNKATGATRIVTADGEAPASGGEAPSAAPGAIRRPREGEPEMTMGEAAREGTGTGAYLKGALDALVGGGASIFGGSVDTFPTTTEAKARVRSFNQMAKSALVNNPRFPVAEQEIVSRMLPDAEALIANPNTELQKLKVLRSTLERAKEANQVAIDTMRITKKEKAELANKNAEIERTLMLLGDVDSVGNRAPTAGQTPRRYQSGDQQQMIDRGTEELLRKYGQ